MGSEVSMLPLTSMVSLVGGESKLPGYHSVGCANRQQAVVPRPDIQRVVKAPARQHLVKGGEPGFAAGCGEVGQIGAIQCERTADAGGDDGLSGIEIPRVPQQSPFRHVDRGAWRIN